MSTVRIYTYLVKQEADPAEQPFPQHDLRNLLMDAESKYMIDRGIAERSICYVDMFGDAAALVETLLPPDRFTGEVAYLLSLSAEDKGEREVNLEDSADESFNYEELGGVCVIENGDNLQDRFAEINAFNHLKEAKKFFNRRVNMFGGSGEEVQQAIENPECKYFFTEGYRIVIERVKYHRRPDEDIEE